MTFGVNGADVITDFNFDEGDRIGLTDGLTELDSFLCRRQSDCLR